MDSCLINICTSPAFNKPEFYFHNIIILCSLISPPFKYSLFLYRCIFLRSFNPTCEVSHAEEWKKKRNSKQNIGKWPNRKRNSVLKLMKIRSVIIRQESLLIKFTEITELTELTEKNPVKNFSC